MALASSHMSQLPARNRNIIHPQESTNGFGIDVEDPTHCAPSSSAPDMHPASTSWLSRFFSGSGSPPNDRKKLDEARPTPEPFANASLIRFVLLCGLWYMSSAMSSNTGKSIMNQFRYPVTLTFVQFAFVAGYCLLFTSPIVPFSKLRAPTPQILRNTFPMALFQVGGHIFSSMAISRVPVSTVHTIKALSPLFTVLAYALLFGVSYSARTYVSLFPLTFGVMLACTYDMSGAGGNLIGLSSAFGSALVFVSSNIFFKKIMPTQTSSNRETVTQKLDKINLLLYSSGMAFLLMIPLWILSDLPHFMSSHTAAHVKVPARSSFNVAVYFVLNGTVHFGQNILAFAILQSTSPVTYSIASLIKRVVVIVIAIGWFNQSVHPLQAAGIGMTFLGLWMYNSSKGDVQKGEMQMRRVEANRQMMLPMSKEEQRMMAPDPISTPEIPQNLAHVSPPIKGHNAMRPIPRPLHMDNKPSFLGDGQRGPSVYPSPPHSPPSTTAPSYHPTHIQHRRGTITGPPPIRSSKPISVL